MNDEYPWNNDPARIDPIIDLLRKTWKLWPDLRLGQLIYNAASNVSDGDHVYVYSVEDAEIVKGLEVFVRRAADLEE